MNSSPTAIERVEPRTIRIIWSDGESRLYRAQELRDHCPCASCRETHGPAEKPSGGLPILSLAETRPVDIESMRPVGNYAYAIQFTDGHNNGIFTFELLRELGSA